MDWKRKLTSRKLWAAICALVTNIIIAFGGKSETAVQVTAIIMAGAAVVAYIIGEGLVDAAAAGCCARAAEALMREYLFVPESLWEENHYFSSLTETRIAFAGSASGESYFFLPLRHFETAIRTAVLHGTDEGKHVGFDS